MFNAIKYRLSQLREKHPRLPVILAALLLAAIIYTVLRNLARLPQVNTEWGLLLILTSALLSLWIGLGGLSLILKRRGHPLSTDLYILITFILAYLIPMVIFILPDWFLTGGGPLPRENLLTAGQPWFYLWQALALAGSSFIRTPATASASKIKKPAIHWRITIGLLTGLAAWLLAAFLYGLLSTPFPGEPAPPSAILLAALLTVSILIAPWAEERFFRGTLLCRWKTRLGSTKAVLLSAALFATLQMRPVLWLPAFVVGLALAFLTLRTQRLSYAILAHALINLLFFLLGWHLVM